MLVRRASRTSHATSARPASSRNAPITTRAAVTSRGYGGRRMATASASAPDEDAI